MVSSLADDVKMTCKKVRFYGLEIVQDKGKGEDEHYVGFKYKCRVVGQKGFKELAEESHSELSTFRRGGGRTMALPRRRDRRGRVDVPGYTTAR